MNILDAVAISLPCQACGGDYQVPLKDVLLSHKMLHEDCPVSQETECPQVFQSRLFEREDVEELQHAWSRLENRARSDGGELVLLRARDLAEMQPAVPMQTGSEMAQRPNMNRPTRVPGEHTPESKRSATERHETRSRQKRERATNKKTA